MIVILLAIFLGRRNTRYNRKTYIVLVLFFLMIETSIRSVTVGSDTESYVDDFYNMVNSSWGDLNQKILERYVLNVSEMDIGHYILGKFFALFSSSFQLYTFFITSIFTIPLGIFLYRYTNNFYQLTFAFVFFIALMLIFPMCGARQMQAIGLAIMSCLYVDKGKFLTAIILILVGTVVHMSILLMLPYVILNYWKPTLSKKLHLLSFAVLPVALLFTNQIIYNMAIVSGMERYEKYGEGDIAGGATTFIVLLILMSVFCYLGISKEYLSNNLRVQKLYMTLPFISLLGPLIYSNGSMIRISMYYHMYLMVLIPYAIENFNSNLNKKTIYIIAIAALAFFSIMGTPLPYEFFWNDPPGTWKN